jgi:dTDP-glucose 4,6-dehydratase
MKIFLTGGCGFIGSNFIHYMLAKYPDVEIRNYDALTYAGNLLNLTNLSDPSRYSFVQGDINNDYDLRKAVIEHSPDALIHFAAESHVDRSIEAPQVFLETNILGTENILRCVKDLKIAKMVHISTDEVYGSLAVGEAEETHAFDPNSPYSVSKASGDMMCRAYFVTYGVPVTVIRGSNCFGPRQHPEKLIPRSATRLLQNLKMGIYGDGSNIREWTYTEDFCAGVDAALRFGHLGEAYNLGAGASNRTDNNKIVTSICDLLGKDTKQNIEYISDRLGHDHRYALNNSKLRKLGWGPKFPMLEGLKATVEWYRENTWWWEPLLS